MCDATAQAWKDTLLFLEQNESEQKVENEQKPKWDTKDDIALVKSGIGGMLPPELLTNGVKLSVGVDVAPAESFTMVTFKLPSKTVATQEAMLTDEMFLAGVAFGMRLNKLLSEQGDSDVKEGS